MKWLKEAVKCYARALEKARLAESREQALDWLSEAERQRGIAYALLQKQLEKQSRKALRKS